MWYRFKIYQHFKKLKRIEEISDPDVQKCIFKYKKSYDHCGTVLKLAIIKHQPRILSYTWSTGP